MGGNGIGRPRKFSATPQLQSPVEKWVISVLDSSSSCTPEIEKNGTLWHMAPFLLLFRPSKPVVIDSPKHLHRHRTKKSRVAMKYSQSDAFHHMHICCGICRKEGQITEANKMRFISTGWFPALWKTARTRVGKDRAFVLCPARFLGS